MSDERTNAEQKRQMRLGCLAYGAIFIVVVVGFSLYDMIMPQAEIDAVANRIALGIWVSGGLVGRSLLSGLRGGSWAAPKNAGVTLLAAGLLGPFLWLYAVLAYKPSGQPEAS